MIPPLYRAKKSGAKNYSIHFGAIALWNDGDASYPFIGEGEKPFSTPPVPIDIDTIGQYIGIDDINGTQIFGSIGKTGGDLIKFVDMSENIVFTRYGIVRYANCSWFIDCDGLDCFSWLEYESIEVIGPEFENNDWKDVYL